MTLLLVTSDQIGLTVTYEMRSVSNRKKPKTNPQKDKTLKFKLNQKKDYTLFLKKMGYWFSTNNKQYLIWWGFRDILNNQGWGKCYQLSWRLRLITLTETLII